MQRKTIRNIALVALKSWAERVGGTRYWTEAELCTLLESHHFAVLSLDPGPPIVAVVRKLHVVATEERAFPATTTNCRRDRGSGHT